MIHRGAGVPLLRLSAVAATFAIAATVAIGARERSPRHSPASARQGGADGRTSIDPDLFDLAFGAASCAVRAGTVKHPSTLSIIDYSKPSTEKRLWVFDLRTRELLYQELVAHGQGSGDNLATMFSNDPETHRSSLGLFVTEDTYVGKNGYSLRLNGLDAGFNDHARERAIVMHGAPYVSEEFASTNHRLGRSWGCPALPQGVTRALIDRIKNGGLVFAYYPDQRWLASSRFLSGCAVAADTHVIDN